MAKNFDVDDILKKYATKIEKEIETEKNVSYSKEYMQFKQEVMPSLSRFERLCKNVGSAFRIRASKNDEKKINRLLEISHLDIKAGDVLSLATLVLIMIFVASALIIAGISLVTNQFSFIALFLFLFLALFVFYFIANAPERISQAWRLKASSQMVPCILYIVVYMRHTSNLDRAIKFASEHLQAPLALDFKKIFWDVEVGKYSTIKESLDAYLETWRDYSVEFIEAFHLIESSLYEPLEARRIEILEKSLQVILDGVYEKMLHYTHDVKAPLTNLYMLGIVLPTLGLALLPLASTLLQGMIKWYHVMIFFNLIIPFFVFYLTSQVLSNRPGGYGETELLEQNPDYHLYTSRIPYYTASLAALPLFILGIIPLLFQYTGLPGFLGLEKDFTFFGYQFFNFKETAAGVVGPFGIGAALLSLFIPLSIAVFFIISYSMKTKILLKTREETKKLENEFASSLFQLGNRLGDGLPAEIAFGRVAESVRGTATEGFFKTVNVNINQLGMGIEQAIFNPRRGAIVYFPSELVKTSMKILVEAVKKGLQVAARALMSISEYVKDIHKINERLRDLLAEIVSDMKSNMTFLAPILAGVVVGLSTMITTILAKLQIMMQTTGGEGIPGGIADITQMLNLEGMIPPFFMQIIVGLYLVEIIFILTGTLVRVESGVDKLNEKSQTAKNLQYGMMLYLLVALIATIALSLIAGIAVGGGGG